MKSAWLDADAVALDSATLNETASLLIKLLSRVPVQKGTPALICLSAEASVIGSAAAARLTEPVDVFVPTSAGDLGRSVRGPAVVIISGPDWPAGITPALERIEHDYGNIAGLVFVHEPRDPTLVERLSKAGCLVGTLLPTHGSEGPEPDRGLRALVPGELDERGAGMVFVRSADRTLTEVPPRPQAAWPALAQLKSIRQVTNAHLPTEPQIFRLADARAAGRSSDPEVPPDLAGSLRRVLLDDSGDIRKLAVELERSMPASKGLGVAVYVDGVQISCQVCINVRNVDGLARTIQLVRDELRQVRLVRPVVLLSVIGASRLMSPAALIDEGIRLGNHSLVMRGPSGPALILAHVPCYMNWTAGQTLGALEKKAGSRAAQVWVSPTWTFWIRESGVVDRCTGGLPNRRQRLRTIAQLSEEIDLVAGHLAEQLDDDHHIANAYYPRVDISVQDGSRARKAIALSALLRVDEFGSGRATEKAASGLSSLATAVWQDGVVDDRPAALLEQSHLLLAIAMRPREPAFARVLPLYLEHIRGCLDAAGIVRAALPPSTPERPYLPGVMMTALATCQSRLEVPVLSESQLQGALGFARGRFAKYPSWPEVWWQLRAWGTVHSFWPEPTVKEFLADMVEWTRRHQLASGAFLTWEWPNGPCLQSVCVAEGLAQAAPALTDSESSDAVHRMVAQALEFCSSLVVDHRHADLWPVPSRAVGGIRSWHGGIELRTDAASHYLGGLLDHRESLLARGESREEW